jgi:uncharacterized protein YlaI
MLVDTCDWCQKVVNFEPETGHGETLKRVGIDQYVCDECLGQIPSSLRQILQERPKYRSIDDDWISLVSSSRASG